MAHQISKILKNAARAPEILRCAEETSQWSSVTRAYLGLSRLEYPFALRLRSGEQVPIEELTDLKAFWQIFLRRIYRVQATDRAILDLGANIGIFTLYAARFAPQAKIFSFEPFPSTFSRLLATVHVHHLDSRVTCLNYAATGANGTRVMPDLPVPSQRRALALTPSPAGTKSGAKPGTQVVGKTLESILEECHVPKVDLLKMDIEGSEYEVLLSTSQTALARIRRIALEYHGDSAPYSKQQLFHHLGKAGFHAAWDICDAQGYGVTEMILRS
jgi:FkbM family methyltransferase